MSQFEVRPPRFAIQVNSRARLTRDYAYFVENRLRERYGMDGIPLIIDFPERKGKAAEGRELSAEAKAKAPRNRGKAERRGPAARKTGKTR
jgi:GTP-binding protein